MRVVREGGGRFALPTTIFSENLNLIVVFEFENKRWGRAVVMLTRVPAQSPIPLKQNKKDIGGWSPINPIEHSNVAIIGQSDIYESLDYSSL